MHFQTRSTNYLPFNSSPALWKLAQQADFSPDELNSLRTELHHFEATLSKLHHLEEELRIVDERHEGKYADGKTEGRKKMDKRLRKQADKAELTQKHLERTIAARHAEL